MSAAKMTARDATHLMLSVAATPLRGPSIKEAAAYLRINSNLPPSLALVSTADRTMVSDTTAWRVGGLVISPLVRLPIKHTAADAIEALVQSMDVLGSDPRGQIADIFITVSDPVPEIEIAISGRGVDGADFNEWHFYSVAPPDKLFDSTTRSVRPYVARYPVRFSLTQSRTFDRNCLEVVASILRSESAHAQG